MKHGKNKPSIGSAQNEFNFGYFYRTIEEQVDSFTAQPGNPYTLTDIAVRVGALLGAKALRETLGDSKRVSQMRDTSSETRSAIQKKDMDVVTRPRRTLSPEARERIAAAQRKRWAKTKKKTQKPAKRSGIKAYWAAMGPAKRRAEMARRMSKRVAA